MSVVGKEEIALGIWVANTNNLGKDYVEQFCVWSQLASFVILKPEMMMMAVAD